MIQIFKFSSSLSGMKIYLTSIVLYSLVYIYLFYHLAVLVISICLIASLILDVFILENFYNWKKINFIFVLQVMQGTDYSRLSETADYQERVANFSFPSFCQYIKLLNKTVYYPFSIQCICA